MESSPKYRSFFISNATEEEIETVIDTSAQEVHWTDKEIQQEKRTISYKTPLLDYSGRKSIEVTLIPQEHGIILKITSNFLEQRSFTRYIFSLIGGRPYDYLDMSQNNKRNIEYLYDVLKKAFKNVQDVTATAK